MAQAKSQSPSFSFHCMICFEEFNTGDRYPVILPCGHTYVCCMCAKRLDKCMECRFPLYWDIPKERDTSDPVLFQNNSTLSTYNRNNSFASYRVPQSNWSTGSRARSAYMGTNSHAPDPQKVKRRLPLPKNVVLLSLIESISPPAAVLMQTENQLSKSDMETATANGSSAGDDSKPLVNDSYKNSDSQCSTDDIKLNTSVATSAAGTYAVATTEGLFLFPSSPAATKSESKYTDSREEQEQDCSRSTMDQNQGRDQPPQEKEVDELDALVRFFHIDKRVKVDDADHRDASDQEDVKENRFHKEQPLEQNFHHVNKVGSDVIATSEEKTAAKKRKNRKIKNPLVRFFHHDNANKVDAGLISTEDVLKENISGQQSPPGHLSYGDRVQVVSIDESGWAKLARGYGYVRADKNQLVKVGGSVDRACKLEAIIRDISKQREQLRREQNKADSLYARLMNELQISLNNDEDLTIIHQQTSDKTSSVPAQDDASKDTIPPACGNGQLVGKGGESFDIENSSENTSASSIYPKKPSDYQEIQKQETAHTGYGLCFAHGVANIISAVGSDLVGISDDGDPISSRVWCS